MRKTVIVASMLLGTSVGSVADWPQYLGPNRNGTSPEKGILRSWPQGGPKVLWTVPVGRGYGGPVVKDGKVYLLDRDDSVGDKLRCFDLASGKELWSFGYDAPGSVQFPGSRSVPAVDGDRVYSCGPYGDLYCIDVNTQKPIWNKNIWKDFGGGRIPTWAITQCPLVYHELVIVAAQTPQAGVVAFDKLSGELKWKTPSLGYVGYASPTIINIHGQDQVVMVTPSTNPFLRSRPDEFAYGTVVGIN
ncbi:MAG: PQQ-like beta-propeller repeat protein, partial [Verrucomicrobiae bacterium]|nr:PQQ-like beta-propeller repeat protein [Verrucomicrobiae bacterium]